MPFYEYECQKCGRSFSKRESFGQHERGRKPKCPHCETRAVDRRFSPVHVQTAKKS